MRSYLYIAVLLASFGTALAPVTAVASTGFTPSLTTYYFSGTCSDCIGKVSGELSLQNYTAGDQINSNNFVSFHYDGSNLVPGGFSITSTPYGIGGMISTGFPQAEYFFAAGDTYYFYSNTDNYWSLGLSNDLDYGTNGTYSDIAPDTSVPEPTSLVLLAAGLAGTALVRRRRGGLSHGHEQA